MRRVLSRVRAGSGSWVPDLVAWGKPPRPVRYAAHLTMDDITNIYFDLIPAHNGWMIHQREYVDHRWDVTRALVFENLEDALSAMCGLARDMRSYAKI
jgi:hypothetical protein